MGKVDHPNWAGDWSDLDTKHNATLWERKLKRPDGVMVTTYVTVSTKTPEEPEDADLHAARLTFARFQLKAQ